MKFEWEYLDETTCRARVYLGWIVKSFAGSREECMVFVPDEMSDWKIDYNDPLILNKEIFDMDITGRAKGCLYAEDIITIGDLVKKTKQFLLQIPNFSYHSLKSVEDALSEFNLKLKE